jgi:hypothetical protein
MSILGHLIAAGRTVASVTRRPHYRLSNHPAVPTINIGRPKAYGNGPSKYVREKLVRQQSPRPARVGDSPVAQVEEPRSLQERNPAPAIVAAVAAQAAKPAPALALARDVRGDGGVEAKPVIAASTAPVERLDPVEPAAVKPQLSGGGASVLPKLVPEGNVLGGSKGAARAGSGRSLRWLKWLRPLGLGVRKRGNWVQAELSLDEVRPVRSALNEEDTVTEASRSRAAFRAGGPNPFHGVTGEHVGEPTVGNGGDGDGDRGGGTGGGQVVQTQVPGGSTRESAAKAAKAAGAVGSGRRVGMPLRSRLAALMFPREGPA